MKVAIVGSPEMASIMAARIEGMRAEVVVLDDMKKSPFDAEPIRIMPRPEFKYMDIGINKPTCSKHHEYVQEVDDDGYVYKSKWICRFCNKKL